MELAPMTKRDKILLYFVLMVAFVVLYIRFLLIPGIENTSRPPPTWPRPRPHRPQCRTPS